MHYTLHFTIPDNFVHGIHYTLHFAIPDNFVHGIHYTLHFTIPDNFVHGMSILLSSADVQEVPKACSGALHSYSGHLLQTGPDGENTVKYKGGIQPRATVTLSPWDIVTWLYCCHDNVLL